MRSKKGGIKVHDNHHHKQENCVSFDNQSASIEHCENTPTDTPFFSGSRRIRVPVNLGEFDVMSNIVANISFPEPVLEIKDIKKRIEIVQCRLLTRATRSAAGSSTGPFPLFIKGFVRKNIQYASPVYSETGECVSSEIKSLTTRVPFQCMTTVRLESPVRLPQLNRRDEFDFAITKDLGPGHPEKDKLHSSDLSQFHQHSEQAYNDLPFCELVRSEIVEWDEATDRQTWESSAISEGTFQNVTEKMQVTLTIRVLQKQNLEVC